MFLEELEDLTFFEKQNIRLIAVTDGTDTASKSYNKLITTVKAAVAEEYSETLSKIPEQHNWNQLVIRFAGSICTVCNCNQANVLFFKKG